MRQQKFLTGDRDACLIAKLHAHGRFDFSRFDPLDENHQLQLSVAMATLDQEIRTETLQVESQLYLLLALAHQDASHRSRCATRGVDLVSKWRSNMAPWRYTSPEELTPEAQMERLGKIWKANFGDHKDPAIAARIAALSKKLMGL